MKKLFAFLMVALLVFIPVFAGGSKEEAAASTVDVSYITAEDLQNAHITIQMWHAQTGENGVALDKVVELFNQTNPYGITVVATNQGGYTDAHQKTLAALSAGSYPNITQAYNNNMMEYMPSGKLMQLDSYLADDFGISQEELSTVVPAYLGENKSFPDGHTYATSLGKSTEVMFYNKTFLDEHGMSVPTTYEELAEVSKAITAITGKPAFGHDSMDNFGIYGPINFGSEYADPQGNIYIFDENNIDTTKAFYQWWQKGINEGYFRTAGEDLYCSGPFGNGDIIIYIGSSSGASYITPNGFEVAVAPNPVGPNPAVIQQGGNFCGFTTGDALVDLATSIVLEYLYTAEAGALYSANTGYAPANKAALETDVYKDSIASGNLQAQAKNVSATYPDEYLAYDPVFENSYGVRQILSDVVENIALDPNADIDALIETAKSEIGL